MQGKVMNIAITIEKIFEKANMSGVAQLTEFEKTVYFVADADFEVNLGGSSGYLYNSSGDNLKELASAMRSIGALRIANAAEDLFERLSQLCNPRLREERYIALTNKELNLKNAVQHFERAIQDQVDNYDTLLEQYIVENA